MFQHNIKPLQSRIPPLSPPLSFTPSSKFLEVLQNDSPQNRQTTRQFLISVYHYCKSYQYSIQDLKTHFNTSYYDPANINMKKKIWSLKRSQKQKHKQLIWFVSRWCQSYPCRPPAGSRSRSCPRHPLSPCSPPTGHQQAPLLQGPQGPSIWTRPASR